MRRFLSSACLAASLLLAAAAQAASAPSAPPLRLYVLDCGYIRVTDPKAVAYFGVTLGDLGGQADMPVTCYLIRHGADWLMFDSGNGDWRHGRPEEVIAGMAYETPRPLVDQLRAIGVTPADLGYLVISHYHLDHVGDVALFPNAKLLIQRRELEATLADPPLFTPAAAVLRLTRPGVTPVDGELDIFGDGSVVIEPTPGHTPGHQSLLVRLPHTGPVILSGDLYHYAAERKLGKVPPGERTGQTPASRARIEALAAREHASVWIEHDLAGFNALKKAPDFYD